MESRYLDTRLQHQRTEMEQILQAKIVFRPDYFKYIKIDERT